MFFPIKRKSDVFLLTICLALFFNTVNLFAQGNGGESTELELVFSHKRGLYSNEINLTLTTNLADAKIYYTTNGKQPLSGWGLRYVSAVKISTNTVFKAVAVTSTDTSKIQTHSFLFPEETASQPKWPTGFPKVWGGAREIAADYEMDPEVTNMLTYKNGIVEAFHSLPTLSLSMTVNDWFDPEDGLYRGYEDTEVITEKAVTAEFIFNNEAEESFEIACGVQNQGGTSIVKWKSPKQSMRLLFKEMYGPKRLNYKLFSDSEINSINTLVVDNMLNATWIHPKDENQRTHAMYMRDQLASDLQEEMGMLAVHGRYFNLYLNGLYWGICNLHERPDDAFLSEYLDEEREDFDIVKHGPDEIVSGSNTSYYNMLKKAREGFDTFEKLNEFRKYVDLPAFIDYIILNFYVGNFDWAQHNWYAGKNNKQNTGYRFYCWDSEHMMRFLELDYNNTGKKNNGAPTEIHALLKENEEYRLMFADAVYKHLFNNGALTPENFRKTFDLRKDEIDKAIVLESARWGDYRKDVSGVTYTKNRHWLTEVYRARNNYIPYRRDVVIEQFRNSKNNLFPDYMPPQIKVDILGQNSRRLTLTKSENASGEIYYTLDGSDPREIGGNIRGQKYTGNINLGKSTHVKARFYSGSDKTWSALAEKQVVMQKVFGENIVIYEIMYHPKDGFPEFLKLLNAGSESIDLKGFEITNGIEFDFKNQTVVDPGEMVVLSNDSSLYKSIYFTTNCEQYKKRLSNKGETVILKNAFNQLVDSVSYADAEPWPQMADGDGYSLRLKSPEMDNALAQNWKLSDFISAADFYQKKDRKLEVNIYPNPFYSNFTIDFINASNELTIQVFNSVGGMVKNLQVKGEGHSIRVDLSGENAGIYMVKVIPTTSYSDVFISKVIKLD